MEAQSRANLHFVQEVGKGFFASFSTIFPGLASESVNSATFCGRCGSVLPDRPIQEGWERMTQFLRQSPHSGNGSAAEPEKKAGTTHCCGGQETFAEGGEGLGLMRHPFRGCGGEIAVRAPKGLHDSVVDQQGNEDPDHAGHADHGFDKPAQQDPQGHGQTKSRSEASHGSSPGMARRGSRLQGRR